jgi:hypothetical protein
MRDVLTLRRARRPLALACLVVVALAVFVPGVAAVDAIAPVVDYVLLAQLEPLGTVAVLPARAEQLRALRTALPERAPPVFI